MQENKNRHQNGLGEFALGILMESSRIKRQGLNA